MAVQTESVGQALQYLGEDGGLHGSLPPSVSIEQLVHCYRTMVLIRQFDQKAIALQRTGKLGTYASCLGQEAVGTAIGCAMAETDVLAPYYRDHAAQYLRGVRLEQMLQYWGGDERGNCFEGVARCDLPNCVPVANQLSHGAGIAAAMKIRDQRRAVVATCGDGATSRGDFYEAVNLAGVWRLPLVVVVNNNQYAISVPRARQTAAATIAQKAVAAGIEGIQVDGNDMVAILHTVDAALEQARSGGGPTLVEAVTYRLSDHTTADDASRYRSAGELERAFEREPIKRLRTFLGRGGVWSDERERQWQERCGREVEQAVGRYLDTPPQNPADVIDYLFEELPRSLHEQREALLRKARLLGRERDAD